jgi:hypothetical protein
MQMRQCGKFNAACASDAQCATNKCNQGLCNGALLPQPLPSPSLSSAGLGPTPTPAPGDYGGSFGNGTAATAAPSAYGGGSATTGSSPVSVAGGSTMELGTGFMVAAAAAIVAGAM